MEYNFDAVLDRRGGDSSKWHRYPEDVLPMYVADMDFQAPSPVIEALHKRVSEGFFGYGRVMPEVLDLLADRLVARYGWTVPGEAIVPVPGVIAAFNLAVRAVTTPGAGLAIQAPAYPPIYNCAGHHGLLRWESSLVRTGSGYEVDWEAFETAAARSSVFLHCNPHNPTGRVFTRGELERMAESCLRHDLVIVSDEIHCDIVFDGRVHVPIAAIDPEVERRTVTLMAPSKTFGLPGLKAAFAVIPDPALRARFEEARSGLVPSVNVLGQAAMIAAYRDGQPWLDALLPYLQANRDFLSAFAAERLPGVRVVPAEGTYLAWLDCREAGLEDDDAQAFFLERSRVAVSAGLDFGPLGRGFTRLCFATPRPLLREGLERMAQALADR